MKRTLTARLAAIGAATGLALATLIGAAGPASAITPVNTPGTFTITAGVLSINGPTTAVNFGTVNTGALTTGGQLGTITVTDARGALAATWTTTVTSTPFTTGIGGAGEVVPSTSILYSSGTATPTGSGALTTPTSAAAAPIGVALVAASWAGLSGNDTATWNPTLSFTLLPAQVAGVYTGTITHSVA